jgi:hypothetical protein
MSIVAVAAANSDSVHTASSQSVPGPAGLTTEAFRTSQLLQIGGS